MCNPGYRFQASGKAPRIAVLRQITPDSSRLTRCENRSNQSYSVSSSTFGLFSLLVRRSTASAARTQMDPVHPKLVSEP
jgi:hypothetical protein